MEIFIGEHRLSPNLCYVEIFLIVFSLFQIYEQETVEKYHNNNHTLKGSFETLAMKPTQRGVTDFKVEKKKIQTKLEFASHQVCFLLGKHNFYLSCILFVGQILYLFNKTKIRDENA